ncbi:hypothetical protein BI350_14670 [Sporosarcina ureilytica]|uniref:RNA polymerase sigma-70 region 2 domain-containing protein n=2 Tax=Sporosarcina ureilytica TaxID=298596 RepID=A0A1D8JKN0_9BACL|nr:hypothetical protein BI350_14670 [Sporosarcina ureilytica]
MITASMRQLHVYRNYEQFRQVGRIALWQAWTRYEEGKGHFAPFASRSIRGAMLDEIKREHRFEEHIVQTEDELLMSLAGEDIVQLEAWSEKISWAIGQLTVKEKELIQLLFINEFSHVKCAELVGISIPGIKKRRERMLMKLREILS